MTDEIFGKVIEVLDDGTAVVETTLTKVLDFVGEERFFELFDEAVERSRNEG